MYKCIISAIIIPTTNEPHEREGNNMKANDMIKVHLYDTSNREIKTRNYDKVFNVYEKNGKLGIDWSTFAPFETFTSSVIFENLETGELFFFSNIENAVVKIA